MIHQQIEENGMQGFVDELYSGATVACMELEQRTPHNEYLNEAEVWLHDWCKQSGFRLALVNTRTDAHGSANLRFVSLLFAYRGANFNIAPPPLAPAARTVYDCIGGLRHAPNGGGVCPDLTPVEAALVARLPSGWNLSDLCRYSRPPLPPPDRELRRLQWRVGCRICPETIYIHPLHHRPISDLELSALLANNVEAWVEQQMALFRVNHWGEMDYESSYSPDYGCWVGGNCESETFFKSYNMQLYVPQHYATIPEALPVYIFDPNSKSGIAATDFVSKSFDMGR